MSQSIFLLVLEVFCVLASSAYSLPEQLTYNITCTGDIGIDHAFGDLRIVKGISTVEACCASCRNESECVAWVLETDNQYCFLKAVTSSQPCGTDSVPCRRNHSARISMANCPDMPIPPPPPPVPAPTQGHWLPVDKLSAKYRNWTYYMGPYKYAMPDQKTGYVCAYMYVYTPCMCVYR